MEHLEKNAFYQKYAEKLKDLEKNKPDVFKDRLQQLQAQKLNESPSQNKVEGNSVDNVINVEDAIVRKLNLNSTDAHAVPEKKISDDEQSDHQDKSIRKLSDILKLELLEDKTAEEISQIWMEHFGTKKCVFAVIPAAEYADMLKKFQQFPLFAYPLPRGVGYEFFVQRFVGNTLYFTTLEMFKKHGDNAFPCFAISHYSEFESSKGIVLMYGEPDTKTISVHEAQLLALQVKLYYGISSGVKFNLVRQFNNSPSTFNFKDVLTEFENYKKDSKSKQEEFSKK